ncbi:MAG: hypothetical protein QOD49_365 [Actinomycetota bacterium]|nr:hypothetical protein [Actinomycetota bacterium]
MARGSSHPRSNRRHRGMTSFPPRSASHPQLLASDRVVLLPPSMQTERSKERPHRRGCFSSGGQTGPAIPCRRMPPSPFTSFDVHSGILLKYGCCPRPARWTPRHRQLGRRRSPHRAPPDSGDEWSRCRSRTSADTVAAPSRLPREQDRRPPYSTAAMSSGIAWSCTGCSGAAGATAAGVSYRCMPVSRSLASWYFSSAMRSASWAASNFFPCAAIAANKGRLCCPFGRQRPVFQRVRNLGCWAGQSCRPQMSHWASGPPVRPETPQQRGSAGWAEN